MKKYNKSNPTEEVKNTNYRMHKGKKGWLVSYSLLAFILGGVYTSSTITTPVKAAEVETQSGVKNADQEVLNEVDERSLSNAKLNAAATLDNEADSVKTAISSDQRLSEDEKTTQIATIDSLVNDAKIKANEATDLVSVKEIIDQTITNINASYQSGNTSASDSDNAKVEKAPKVDKTQKPVTKKVNLSTYKGLSSFFKTVDGANDNLASSSIKKDVNRKASSMVASNVAANAESAKLTSVDARDSEPANSANEATVASDKDEKRPAFNDLLGQASGKTETSVDVPVPEQVTNPDKSISRDVATLEELAAAWNNAAVTYVNVTADIAYDYYAVFGIRAAGASLVINGNGHTIDMGNQNFEYQEISYRRSPVTYLTLINTHYKQGFSGSVKSNKKALIYTSDGSNLAVNFDNIRLSVTESLGYEYHAIRAVRANNSRVTFSGKNVFVIANEVVRGAGSIYIANDSSVIMERTEGAVAGDDDDDVDPDAPAGVDSESGEFAFTSRAPEGSIGEGNQFVMGDRSSNAAGTLKGVSADFPALYRYVYSVKVGDDVSWMQEGFQYFIDGTRAGAGANDATYVFGQNFKLDCPATTRGGAIQLRRNQSMLFNAGTTMRINQRAANRAIINLANTSSVTFISPKELDLSVSGQNDVPAASRRGVVAGSGSLRINNSSIRTWDGTNSSTNMPEGQYTGKFTNMTITNGKATVSSTSGSINPNIMSANTRELQTDAIAPGKVKIQFIDQTGKQVGQDYELPFGGKGTLYEDAYIGQAIPLVSQDIVDHIPAGYMWALGNQIYAGAKADKQSGGSGKGDQGDADGQANIAYVPMDTDSYTYKVYVYGVKQNVTYKYVDVNHPDKVLTPKNIAGTEADNGLVTANYGNTIDWTNKYYTETNVPAGYHYKIDAANQPATMVVSDNNPTVILYVEGDEQEITPTYIDANNNALSPANPIVIKGRTGDTITIPDGPEIPNMAVKAVIFNGTPVSVGSTFEMPNQKDLGADQKYTLVYKYEDLTALRNNAITEINNKLTEVKQEIDNDSFLTDDKKQAQKADAENRAKTAIDAINSATTASGINKIVEEALPDIEKAHVPGTLEEFKQHYKDLLDQEVSRVKGIINTDKTLNSTEKAAQSTAAETAGTTAKEVIDQDTITTAEQVLVAYNEGIDNIRAAHQSVDLANAKTIAKGKIDEKVRETKTEIDNDSNLSDARKKEQKANAEAAGAKAKNNIDLATTGDELEKALNDGLREVENAHVKLSLDEIKSDACADIDRVVAETKAKINADKALTTEERNTQIANAEAAGISAKDKINAATTGEEVAKALDAGINAVKDAYKQGNLADAKLRANGAIDAEVALVKEKIDADKHLPADKKNAQKAAAESKGVAAKNKINAATTGDEVAQALADGIADVDSAYVAGTLADAQQMAKEEIDREVAKYKGLIAADNNLSASEKNKQTANVEAAGATAKSNIDSATSFEEVEKALSDGKAAIAAAYVPGDLDGAKAKAKAEIDAEVKLVESWIDADKILSAAQKAKQKQDAQVAGEKAKNDIDAATSGEGVALALRYGKAAVDATYVAGTLKDAKDNGKQAIAEEASKVKGKIDADNLLTTAEKVKQKQDVDKAVAEANAAIDAATSFEEVAKAVEDGKAKINAAYKPGKDLSDQKA
ncbi:DUF1542 domain-containing protein, partial [Lactobacillus apis]|uniref:DUF1542 domain-containing protein n=1 Tax=Lactobacillus apis TaxID=303541 RepID=UPI0024317701